MATIITVVAAAMAIVTIIYAADVITVATACC